MSHYFYLTTNSGRDEPEDIKSMDYIHVKAKTDGSQTIVITSEQIEADGCEEKTKEEAQSILNSWIDTENAPPVPVDVEGKEIVQPYVYLEAYLD